MSKPAETVGETLIDGLDLDALAEWLEEQRWYASKSRHVTGIEIDESVWLAQSPPMLLTLVQARFASGSHELYQLPLTFVPPGVTEPAGHTPIQRTVDAAVFDAVADPERARVLLRAIDAEEPIETENGWFRFHRTELSGPLAPDAPVRPVGVEQSNSSIVFGDETVLKVFRKLEPGINPELELLQFLTSHEYANIAPCWAGTSTTDARLRPRSALPSASFPTPPADGNWPWRRSPPIPRACWSSSASSAR